ncbi:hypothetical protein FOZ60_010325 [Perkinsus olseni]|uniref:Ankyrin Repeat Protein n=1 Tax=Perkinsus olseni TaxID=32597 RepID=A0A7J6PE47_PEROL|nr:hypothetical protein FOZ60_010325 [Perkinsus olseni]
MSSAHVCFPTALMKTISALEGWIELDAGCAGRHNALRSLTRGSEVRCGRRCCNEGDAMSCCGKCGCRIMEPEEARRCRTALQKNCGDVAHRCCGGCCGESCTSELDPDCEVDDRSRGLEEDLANGIDSDGRPALVRAALWRRPDLVRDLLDQGADPTEPSSGVGDTAIRVAVEGHNEDVLGEIINHVGPSARDLDFHTIERKRIALKELMSVEDKAGRRVSDYPDALAIQMAICRAYEYMLNICEFVVDDVPRPDLMAPKDPRVLPVHVDAVDWSGETALFSAVRRGHLRKAEFLLDHGAAVDKEVWGRTALHEAVRVGAVGVMKLLLKHGADPNSIAEVDGLSCLHVAMTRGGNSDVIRSLLDHGADPAVRSAKVCNFTIDGVERELPSGSTAMHFAMQLERRDLAALVLDCLGPRPSDVDSTVRDEKSRRWTDLELAASTGNLSEVKTLIARGADPRAVNENGQTALHFAAVNGHPSVVELLVEKGANLKCRGYCEFGLGSYAMVSWCGRIPLVLAVQQKQKGAVRALVHYKPSISTEQLLKAVQLAHGYDDEEILSILRESDGPSNSDSKDQQYHCMGVHIEGNTRAPWEQEDAHAQIQSVSDKSTTPPQDNGDGSPQQAVDDEGAHRRAPSPDDFDIASLEEERRGLFSLLNNGSDVSPAEKMRIENSLTEIGKRMHEIESLIQSSIFGQLERMIDLICNNVDSSTPHIKIDSTDELGWTPLHWAAYKGHSKIVKFLLERGADTRKLTRRESASPLICAVARRDSDPATRLQIVRALLEHGALPNTQDGDGETPLHFAVGFLEYDVAKVLLENGADPSIRTRYSITVGENNFAAGSTALHYAHQLRAENLIRLIASYAGRSDDVHRELDPEESRQDVHMTRDGNGHTPVQVHPRWPCYMI